MFLPNFSTKEGGSGLGLAIAKRGIEHAGGNIWLETTTEIGTSFFISLPLAPKLSDKNKQGDKEPSAAQSNKNGLVKS